jgi:adenylyltransferase/sulfurtransferase
MLPQIDIEGQQKLLGARALIIGAGGLGSPAAMYLAAAGVGEIAIADFDEVDLSNLQRQIIHTSADIGKPKVASAEETMLAINPLIKVIPLNKRLENEILEDEVKKADVVLDCCDNFTTRFAVNSACVKTGTPLVSGAAIRFEGQLSVFIPSKENSPCYNCLYPNQEELAESCTQTGVVAPITGIIGSMQALEAIKVITNIGTVLCGKVLLLDGMSMECHSMVLPRNPNCPTCST